MIRLSNRPLHLKEGWLDLIMIYCTGHRQFLALVLYYYSTPFYYFSRNCEIENDDITTSS